MFRCTLGVLSNLVASLAFAQGSFQLAVLKEFRDGGQFASLGVIRQVSHICDFPNHGDFIRFGAVEAFRPAWAI